MQVKEISNKKDRWKNLGRMGLAVLMLPAKYQQRE